MSSENFGLSWATVAWNVHPLTNYYRYESGYLLTDYNWYMTCCPTITNAYNLIFVLGVNLA